MARARRLRWPGPLLALASFLALCAGSAPAWGQVDPAALARLAERSSATRSDAVVVYLHGRKIYEYHSAKPPRPIFLMSCTKSIVGLAVGRAIADGKIKSLDEPVSDFFPEWNQGRKKLITIRHLLAMTSGLQHNGRGDEIYPLPDSVKMALAAELVSDPGAVFSYNNKSVNLLAGIIHVATGQWLDQYVDDKFFTPMDISFWQWSRDDAGNAYAMADLALLPEDFAKFGALVLAKGQWQGKLLVPASWIEQMGEPSQAHEADYGLLWWRLPFGATGALTAARLAEIAKAGADPKLIAQLRPLIGRPVHSPWQWHRLLASAVPDWEARTDLPGVIGPYGDDLPTWRYQGFDGLAAEGYLGQYLVVFPSRDLVAVRLIDPFDGYDYMKNRFEDFADTVRDLAPATPTPRG